MKKVKFKKTGICRREVVAEEVKNSRGIVIIKAELGDLSMTDNDLKAEIRNQMRKIWTTSVRRIFLQNVRFKINRNNRSVWAVSCARCSEEMPTSQKEKVVLKSGKLSKLPKLLFEIDHIEANPPFVNILEDIGPWINNMFYGKLRVLCRDCHAKRTKLQNKNKPLKKEK